MQIIKNLPTTAQYIYSVDDIDGSVNKLYRARSGRRLYLVTRHGVYSITPDYLSELSNKLLDSYERLQDKSSE